jgi:hypothetical protein
MPRKLPGRADSLRIAIAQEAARLMVESGTPLFRAGVSLETWARMTIIRRARK